MQQNTTHNIITSTPSHNAGKRISVLEIIGTATLGGMENHIAGFLKNLSPDQFKVTCICPCESQFTESLRQLGVEDVFITPIADNPDWRSIQMAAEVARLHKADILHAHMPKSHVLAAVAGSFLNKPVIATVHGMHVTAHELGVALMCNSHLITNCQETYIQALALGIDPVKLSMFHNGVDTRVFNSTRTGKIFRELISIDKDATLVGFAGRLEFDKGPDQFLRAAAAIHEVMPAVHFAIVGAGSMLKQLNKMTKQMQLERHVHFADWSLELAEVYPAFDLLAHTSRNDGTSLVMLEAMACGLPVVGMAVGGIKEIISNEHTGLLTEPGNCEAFASEVVKLLEQPGLLKQMGEAGRKRVEEQFNVVTNTHKTAGLLKDLVAAWNNKSLNSNSNTNGHFMNGNGAVHSSSERLK